MRRAADTPALLVRIVRATLALYPRAFRERFGREIEQTIRAAYADQRAASAYPFAFWWRTIGDLLVGAGREHVASWRDRRLSPPRRLATGAASLDIPSTQADAMGTLAQDLRYAWRTVRRSPGFALVVIVSLALGIGANALIYSVVDGILLRPFPYPDADRLVSIGVTYPALDGDRSFIEAVSPPEYAEIRDGMQSIVQLSAFDLGNRNISGGDRPERVFTGFIWGDPMSTVGVRPLLGRSFRAQETVEAGPQVAVISHRIWQSRFGGDSSIVGSSIRVDGVPTEIVGVMPPGFLLLGTDLWLPMRTAPANIPRQVRNWTLIGRLRDGTTLTQANAEVRAMAGRIEREYGRERKEYVGWRMDVVPWAEAIVGEFRSAGTILLGAVALVLLIACTNIASLLLARATGRQRELAVRRALGADRARLARQLLTENLLLAFAGALVGLAIAYALLGPTTTLFPRMLRDAGIGASINGRVLLFTLVATVASGLIFGVAPTLQGVRGAARDSLAGEGTAGRLTTSAAGRRLRNTFVVVEIALSIILLVGAGVLLRSFARLQRVDAGIDTHNVLTMRISLPREQYRNEAVGTFFEEVSRRLAETPGVRAAGATTQFPPGNVFTARIAIDGKVPDTGEQLPTVDITNVAGDYFGAMGYSLRAGRLLATTDAESSPLVGVITEATARRFFSGENPIGQRIALGQSTPPKWVEIVGVVGDVRNHGLSQAPAAEVFVPVRQQVAGWNNQLFLTIRTQGDPLAMLPAVRRTIATVDAEQPVYSIRTLDAAFAEAVAQRRIAMLLISIFAGVALVLAAVGIYGLMSYMVNERTQEIGIRMALGAVGSDVMRLVVRQTLKLVAIGAALGLAGSVALGGALRSLVFEVRPTDPATLAGVTVAMMLVALVATIVPARRATRVTPLVALRRE